MLSARRYDRSVLRSAERFRERRRSCHGNVIMASGRHGPAPLVARCLRCAVTLSMPQCAQIGIGPWNMTHTWGPRAGLRVRACLGGRTPSSWAAARTAALNCGDQSTFSFTFRTGPLTFG